MSINFIVQVESSEKSDSLQTKLITSENSNVSENSPSEFVENCTTCLQQKLHEFTLPCKHSFCESCIVKWTENKEDPVCSICRYKLKNDNNLKVLLNERKQMPNLLRKACSNGDFGALQVFIEKGAKLDNDLIHLVQMDRLDIFKILFQNGADINGLDKYGKCLLYNACLENNLELVKFLFSQGANPKLLDNDLIYLLHMNRLDIFKILFQNGADINGLDKYGQCLLYNVCLENNLELVKFLLSQGANPNVNKPLFYLLRMDRLDIFKILIQNGADINGLGRNGKCLLYNACLENDLELVKFLLLNDANPNVNLNNPLNAACGKGNLEIIKALIGKGANPNIKDDYGMTSLKIACAFGLIENVEVLLNAGAIIDEINEFGNTPLLIACAHDHSDIFKLLIDRGARLELDGVLIHFAVRAGSKKVVEYLILKKVNVNSVDKEGLTPLDLAYRRCDFCNNPYVAREIIDILIAHDAVRSKK